MQEEETKTDLPPIWTPPRMMDASIAKMAWLLFLKAWEAYMVAGSKKDDEDSIDEWATNAYDGCVRIAEIIEAKQKPKTPELS